MVYILLAEGFEEVEALVPADLLRRAGLEVALVGLDELPTVGSHGITVQADILLSEVDTDKMDMLVIPGGRGVETLQMNLFAMALIQKASDRGCYLAAICAAPTLLSQLGISDRRKVTCYPGLENQMGSAVVQRGETVVVDGRIITGQGPGASFPFALTLIDALAGPAVAEQVRRDACVRP